MKFTVVLIMALAITSYALTPKKVSLAQKQQIDEIKKSNSWAHILINLAELNLMAKGPVDDLIEAIQDCVADL